MQTKIIFFLLILSSFLINAHEGHQHVLNEHTQILESSDEVSESILKEGPSTWIEWIGTFHLIALHFPIALINTLVVSECLAAWLKKPLFEFASQFMLNAAATLAPITVLLGIIYSYSSTYEGVMEGYLHWHMWLGIASALLTIALALFRERKGTGAMYYSLLGILFLLINATSFYGSEVTFGVYHLYPPL